MLYQRTDLSSLLARRRPILLNRDPKNRAYSSRETIAPNISQRNRVDTGEGTRPVCTRNADLRLVVAHINTPLGSACQQEASAKK